MRVAVLVFAAVAFLVLTAGVVRAAVPSSERLSLVLGLGLSGDPVRKNSTSLGTTITDAIDTDITNKTSALTQMFVVTNLDSVDNVCVGSIAFDASSSCETLCGTAGSWTGQGYAATMNCTSGDASQGSVITAGNSRSFRYDGTRCVCMVASAASTVVQAERYTR